MKFSNKDLYCLLFSELSPGKWKCNSCKKVYKEGRGYTNQMHLLLKMHPDYPQLAEAVFRKGSHLGLSLPDQRTSKVFRWIEWCVVERMPPHPVLLALDHATVTKHGMAKILLTDEKATHAHELLKKLGELNEVTKALQDSTLTLVGARRSFYLVARKYPRMKARLASDAPVVNYPDLETGIVKIILGSRLSAREQAACASFKCSGGNVTPAEESRSFLASVFKKTSKSRTAVYMALE
ncbi:hypothetical protein PRNP1_000931 [Phytophthora ramorum]